MKPNDRNLHTLKALPVHVGGAVLQTAVTRHVVVAVPLNVYPALHEYVDVLPVVPVVGETLPNAGFNNDGHALAATSLLNRKIASKQDQC